MTFIIKDFDIDKGTWKMIDDSDDTWWEYTISKGSVDADIIDIEYSFFKKGREESKVGNVQILDEAIPNFIRCLFKLWEESRV